MLRSWSTSTYFCQAVEGFVTIIILLAAWIHPRFGARGFEWAETSIKRLTAKPLAAAVLIFTSTILLRWLLLPFFPVPHAFVQDEFSYLLAAQTFAAGRLANPTPSFWQHFESVHILQVPSYMSMYPPAQGLFLAAGLRLFGTAWAGVLLSVALLCAAVLWALRAWFSNSWAFTGAFLVLVRWGLASYWVNTYWGGAVPALGGALVVGSVARLMRGARPRHAATLGLGIVILVNSRPYEGSVLIVVSIAVLLVFRFRRRAIRDLLTLSVLLPVALILASAAAAMLMYNSRVTKDPFRLPYVEDRRQYASAPLFIWGRLKPEPAFRSSSLRRVYEAEARLFETARRDFGIPEMARKAKNIWIFYLGPLLTIPAIALLFLKAEEEDDGKRARHTLLTAVLAGTSLALVQVVWFYPHYAAPSLTALVGMLLLGLKRLRQWHPDRKPVGLFLSRMVPVACMLMATIPVAGYARNWELSYWPLQWALGSHINIHPAGLERRWLKGNKKALFFVRYGPKHDVGEEWVYNSADLDSSSIIWAREVSPESDGAVASYYAARGRSIWFIYPDKSPIAVEPYTPLPVPRPLTKR